MQKNLYNFLGPLDPVDHQFSCVFRSTEIGKVINGLLHGDYWVILGPRQIGKTTFLRQIKHELLVYPSVYIDLESFPNDDESFYSCMINTILENIPSSKEDHIQMEREKNFGHQMNFYNFLRNFKPRKNEKIILFFDEIEKAASVNSFLRMWRKIFHERIDYHELKKYAIVIAGSMDLLPLTIGPTSPFNIARKLYLGNLREEECMQLIDIPFKELELTIDASAKKQLINQTSGHPQLLQHLCYILADSYWRRPAKVCQMDIETAIEEKLFFESDNLKTLEHQLKVNQDLMDLVKRLIKEEKIKYAPHQHFSLEGVGPIVADNKYCKFRCPLYKEYLEQLLDPQQILSSSFKEKTFVGPEIGNEIEIEPAETNFKTTIYIEKDPCDFSSEENEEDFLNCLFKYKTLEVKIERNNKWEQIKQLKGKEKLMFCYLAYKNYKAMKKDGYLDWKNIPDSYKYRLSSNPINNDEQKPEWQSFINYLLKIGEKKPVDQDIRQWKYCLQKLLQSIGMQDIIDSKKSGRGGGYLLKGIVQFHNIKTSHS